MAKYEYKFVRVQGRENLLTINIADSAEYQRVIKEHADMGWRFIQIFAPAIEGFGVACNADVIFEREAE